MLHSPFIHKVKQTLHSSLSAGSYVCTMNGSFKMFDSDIFYSHIIKRSTVLVGCSDCTYAGSIAECGEIFFRPFFVHFRKSCLIKIQIIRIFIVLYKSSHCFLSGSIISDRLLLLFYFLSFLIKFPSEGFGCHPWPPAPAR